VVDGVLLTIGLSCLCASQFPTVAKVSLSVSCSQNRK
jgi:hypothetical protein